MDPCGAAAGRRLYDHPPPAMRSFSPPKCTAVCLQRLQYPPRRPWILAEPLQADGSSIIPLPAAALRSSHGAVCLQRLSNIPAVCLQRLSNIPAVCLQRLQYPPPPPMDPCGAAAGRRLYTIIAATWACIANSAALNVCACAMANSVRLRQSRINSPKNGYPTCPATAKCCSRC